MIIKFTDKCGDFDGPVLDIMPEGVDEAFDLGRLFEKISLRGKCVWRSKHDIRIPLIDMDAIGLAVIPELKNILKDNNG